MGHQLSPGTWKSRYKQELKKNPGSVGLIMEGDSWFALTNLLRTNIYLALDAMNGPHASLWSLAHSGDTAHEIAFGEQRNVLTKHFKDKTLQIDGFLFSAGGNDLVGSNLLALLNEFEPGMTWKDCIDAEYLKRKFQDLRDSYERIVGLRNQYRPATTIFTHSYDLAEVSGKGVCVLWLPLAGGWLKNQFEQKGILDTKLQAAIITNILRDFASLMQEFADREEKFIHVNSQGTLLKDDWGDELHPTMLGFKKISAKFQNELRKVFPSLPAPATV